MQRKNYEWFDVRKGYRQSLPFLIVSAVMIIAGLILLAAGITGPGIAVGAMGVVFIGLLLPQASAIGRSYGIGERGLLLGKLTSELELCFSDIESAAVLNGSIAREFLEDIFSSAVESERNMDLSGWYRSNKKAAGVARWMSVPLTGTEIRKGGPVNITDFTVNPGGGLLLLRLKDGRRFLLSPLDLNGFYTRLLKNGVAGIPATAGEGLSIQEVDTKGAGRRTGRIMRTVSGISFVIILLLVGYFFIFPALRTGPGSDSGIESEQKPDESVSAEPIAGWVDEDTFVFAVERSLLPEMEREGSVSALIYTGYAAPMMLQLLESEGSLPEGASADKALSSYLGDFMKLHTILRFVYTETPDTGAEINVYTVEATELKKFIVPLLQNYKKSNKDG